MALRSLLLVDDDERMARAFVRNLKAWPTVVDVVGTVVGALQAIHEIDPEAIVVDLHLPDGRGADVIREAVAQRPAPVVVAISGLASLEEAGEAVSLGALRVYDKPFEAKRLMDDLEQALGTAARELALVQRATQLMGLRDMDDIVERIRDGLVEDAIRTTGSKRAAARLLGIGRPRIYKMLARHGDEPLDR